MIPRPPREAFPDAALDLALSGPRLLRLLQQAGSAAEAIERIQPERIWLEPGRRCRIRYALRLARGSGGPRHRLAHLRLVIGTGEPAPPRPAWMPAGEPPALHLPELEAELRRFPDDPELPGLALAARPADVAERLAGSPIAPEGAPDLRRWRVEDYAPGRRARLRYSLRVPAGALYARGELRRPLEAARLAKRAARLARAGLAAPQALARPEQGLLLLLPAQGPSLAERLDEPLAGQDLAALAALLRRLEALDPAREPRRALRPRRLGRIGPALERSMRLLPALAPRMLALAAGALRALEALDAPPRVPRSALRAEDLCWPEAGPALDRLDGLDLGPGVGNAASLAADLGLRALCGEPAAEDLREAWLEAWRQGGPSQDGTLAAAEALCLLGRLDEPFERLEPDWPEAMTRRLALAERRMAAIHPRLGSRAGRSIAPSGAAGTRSGETPGVEPKHAVIGSPPSEGARSAASPDPGLPQLAGLCAAATMGPRLRRVLGDPGLELRAIEVLRHKPGRRCLLRYELQTGHGEARALIGKTFASSRGPRVYELHRRIHAARALGPAVHLPQALAYLPDLKLLLLSELPGQDLAPRLLAGDPRPAEAMARALASLHGSALELEREHGLERELALLERRVAALAEPRPALARELRASLGRLELALAAWRPLWRRMPVHRDGYHEQFLWGRQGLSALDFDDASMSEPCLDAGNLLAHLELLACQQPEAAARLARARAAFEDGLEASPVDYPPGLLRLMEAASLLRLVTIHRERPEGARVARGLLAAARGRLAAAARLPSARDGP